MHYGVMQVNFYEVKTRLCELVDQASRVETVIIAKAGTPLATCSPATRFCARTPIW